MRAWILAMALVAGCKGNKDKDSATTTTPSAKPANAALPTPKVAAATALAKIEDRPPFVLVVDDAGTARLGAAKTWADLDAGTLKFVKKPGKLDAYERFVRESYGLMRDPISSIESWDEGTDIDLSSLEDTATKHGAADLDDPPPPPDEDMPDDGNDESGGTGTALALEEGKMGKKDSDRAEGQYKMKRMEEDPQLARQQAIEQARAAGILGRAGFGIGRGTLNEDGSPSRVAQTSGAVTAKIERLQAMIAIAPTAKATKLIEAVRDTGAAIAVAQDGKIRPLNVDFDVRDTAYISGGGSPYWLEARVSAKAIVVEAVPDKPIDVPALDQLGAAIDKARTARGAESTAPVDVLVDGDVDAQRLVDVIVALEGAGVKSIGMGPAPSGEELARRGHRTAVTRLGSPIAQGDLDKALIRKVVKNARPKIAACYEKALIAGPSLAGTVQAQFFIKPDGKVARAATSGVSPEVAKCVQGVIMSLEFPKPKGGGGVQVNYPFNFRN